MAVTIINGDIDTALTCTISAGATGCEGTCSGNCSVAQGALVYGRLNVTGAPGFQNLSVVIEHSGPQFYGQRSTLRPPMTAGSYYSSSGLTFAAEGVRQPSIIPHSGTIQNLHVRSGGGTIATDAVVTVCSGSVTPTECSGTRPTTTVVAANTTYDDLSNTAAVSAGDFFEVQLTKAADLATTNVGFSFEIAGVEQSADTPTQTPNSRSAHRSLSGYCCRSPLPAGSPSTIRWCRVASSPRRAGCCSPIPVSSVLQQPLR